jgi:hypothetical protein
MNASAPADAKICSKASRASACIFVIRGCMFLLSLTATCQVCTVSLKAGLYTYKECLHVAIAQGAARGEPDAMTDDFTGKTVVLVPLGVSWGGMSGYLSWGATGHGGDIAGGNYVMAQAGWSTS